MEKRRWQRRPMRLDVEVCMWGRNGLGVSFCRPDSQTIKALHRMLQWRSYYPLQKQVDNETAN